MYKDCTKCTDVEELMTACSWVELTWEKPLRESRYIKYCSNSLDKMYWLSSPTAAISSTSDMLQNFALSTKFRSGHRLHFKRVGLSPNSVICLNFGWGRPERRCRWGGPGIVAKRRVGQVERSVFISITCKGRPIDTTCLRCWDCVTFVFQAYHSQFNSEDNRLIGNLALLPVRTSYKGPAPKTSNFPQ